MGATILRLPPLIGFLGAGFAVSAVGVTEIPFIDVLAELGVTVLLFSIGLKLNPRDIAEPRVIGTAAGHAVTNTALFAVVFGVLGLLPLAALGALIAGIMRSGHPVSDRVSDALVSVRELLLVAFFIQIGLAGIPNAGSFFIVGLLTVLLVAKTGLFIVFLQRVGMSNRTSALGGLTLANYSEFGLIVISVGVGAGVLAPSWLPIMGVAVAASFIVGSVVMRWEDRILPVLLRWIPEVPEERLMPDERAVVVRHCDALVQGMGRVGEGGCTGGCRRTSASACTASSSTSAASRSCATAARRSSPATSRIRSCGAASSWIASRSCSCWRCRGTGRAWR